MEKSKRNNKRRARQNGGGRRLAALEKAIFSEKRYLSQVTGGSVSTTPSYLQLTTMAVGDTDGTRLGARVSMDHLDVTCDVTNADSPANIVRMIVFVDKNDNGAGPSGAAGYILSDPNSYPWISPINQAYCSGPSRRYHILRDIIFNPGSSWQPVQRKRFRLQLRGLEATYNSTSSVPPLTNSINVLLVSDSSVTTHPAYIVSTQLRYSP